MTIEKEIERTLAEYLATDFEHGPFSDTAFARAEVEPDGMVSLFASDSESAWPVASFDAPQLAEWIARSPLLNRVRAEALREHGRVVAYWERGHSPKVLSHSVERIVADLEVRAATIEQNSEWNET